jgi:N-terminal domain of anti-restriction factor ArdC
MKRDLYAEVSTRIVAELEAGAAPWVKPWSATPGVEHPLQRRNQPALFRMQCRSAVDGTSGGLSHAALSDIQSGIGARRQPA